MFKKLRNYFKKRTMSVAKLQEANGPICEGEVWQIGTRFFRVQKVLTKGRVVVKLIKG